MRICLKYGIYKFHSMPAQGVQSSAGTKVHLEATGLLYISRFPVTLKDMTQTSPPRLQSGCRRFLGEIYPKRR